MGVFQRLQELCGGGQRRIVIVAVMDIGKIQRQLKQEGANHVATTKVVDGEKVHQDQFTMPGGVIEIFSLAEN